MKKYFEVSACDKTGKVTKYQFTFSESRLIGQIAKDYAKLIVEVREITEADYKLLFGE